MSRALHVEQALAVLVDADLAAGARAWTDDRFTAWRDALTDPATYPDASLLPVAARAYARQRHIHGGHENTNLAGFASHYRAVVAIRDASAPTPPPGPKDQPLAGPDALEALRAARAATFLANRQDNP